MRREGIWITDTKLLALKIYHVYRTILQVPQIKAMFQSRKHLRFLMHLIGHTTSILKSVVEVKTVKHGAVHFDGDPNVVYFGSLVIDDADSKFFNEYHPILKYFQHSCYPNALRTVANGQAVMMTVRPIEQGEQVFKSRIPIDIERTMERQKHLSKCECPRCKGVFASPEQRRQLSSEPAFIELVENCSGTSDESEKTIENCAILLRKYGHIDWCDEIKLVLLTYHKCLCTKSKV